MNDRYRGFILGAALLILIGASRADAQTRNRVDNRGKEFRIAFLLTNGADNAPHLALDIAAEKPTTGTLTYVHTGQVVPIPLLQPNVPVRIELDTTELMLPDPARYPISNFTVYLKFSDEVVVYGMNTQRWSSDNFLALPYEVLGTEHVVLSYPNTIDPNPAAAVTRASDFPSQFAVVAMEDNTQVTVEPSARLKGRPDTGPFTITLNAGEVYFAQANGRAGTDVTGSVVRSTKRVVVYGSHQRANIPWDEAVGRDHLVEQLPPVNRWANRAIVTPHYQLPKTVNDRNLFRVLAAQDNTQIFFDSVFQTTLNARQFAEYDLDGPKMITATGPILVAQFHHSSVDEKFVSRPNDSVGDPFMMLATAPEQFDSVYWFESYASKDFTDHFVNVVIPTERVSSLLLDGFPVSVQFAQVGRSSYSFAEIPVSIGFHKMSARAPFGMYAYGFGVYNSYGAPGAMVFDSLFKDQKEPSLAWKDSCGGAAGYALDDGPLDFGVESMRLLSGSANVRLEVDPFTPGKDSVHFRIPLIDPYQDGEADVMVVDTAGLRRHYTFPVKGFTVAMVVGQTAPVQLDTLASLNGQEFCRTITLTNYG
nr:IgGFc-binding protein [Candidatus Kapabacteria bacterium]